MANATTSVFFDLIGRDKGASASVEKVGQAADKSAAKFEKMQGVTSKLGGGLGKMIPVVAGLTLGVASLGAAWDATIGAALGLEAGVDKLQGRLGLTEKAAKRAGDVSAKIFGEAWGDSVEDVNATIQAVGTNLVDIEKVSKRELTKITRNAQVLADTFDIDVNEATRAAGQLMRTGLAKDATEAFDLITKGFQSGANRSDDFLDTLNEYAPQFRKLGISGPYAVSLISAALKAGARDSDVAADAIKEFSIRSIDGSEATAAGFKAAGLNAREMADRIAEGGPTAEKAFQQTLKAIMSIEDPVKRDAAGVALLGTQWEDLGPTVVGAMAEAKPGVEGLTGAARRLGETVGDNVAAKFEALKRKAGGWLSQIGGVALPLLDRLADAIEKKVVPAIERWIVWFSGPGKFVVADTFLVMVQAGLAFVSDTIKGLRELAGYFVAWSKAFLTTALIAFGWVPGIGPKVAKARRNFEAFGDGVLTTLDKAAKKVDGWNRDVDSMRKEIRLRGNIEDLERKIDRAKERLKEKGLTEPERSKIRADISQLEERVRKAKERLGSIRDRTVRVTAILNSDSVNAQLSSMERRLNLSGRREHGGPVKAGQPYIVGEKRPELFVPKTDGMILPSVPQAMRGGGATGRGIGTGITVEHLEIKAFSDRFDLRQVQDELALRGVA